MNATSSPEYSLQIGSFQLDTITEFYGPRMLPGEMFPSIDPQQLARLMDQLPGDCVDAATGKLITTVQTWVVRDSSGLVLLADTCCGNAKQRPKFPFFHMMQTNWLEKLGALGVAPEDVTHVVNTHLHHDHVGWNTRLIGGAWVPTFPNARYYLPAVEVIDNGATTPDWNDGAYADSVAPIVKAGLAELVTPPTTLAIGVRLTPVPGHSPGMMVLEVADEAGGGIFLAGDFMHHAIQVLAPEVNSRFCEDPISARASRATLLERAADEGWKLAGTHFFSPRIIGVRRDGPGYVLA